MRVLGFGRTIWIHVKPKLLRHAFNWFSSDCPIHRTFLHLAEKYVSTDTVYRFMSNGHWPLLYFGYFMTTYYESVNTLLPAEEIKPILGHGAWFDINSWLTYNFEGIRRIVYVHSFRKEDDMHKKLHIGFLPLQIVPVISLSHQHHNWDTNDYFLFGLLVWHYSPELRA